MSDEASDQEIEEPGARVVLIVPKTYVKSVKSALERAGLLDRSSKIVPESTDHVQPDQENIARQQRMCIPTTIPSPVEAGNTSAGLIEESGHELKSSLLRDLNLEHLSLHVAVGRHITGAIFSKPSAVKSPVHKALKEALFVLQELVLADTALSAEALVTAFPDGYSIYKPMLLLPHNAFASMPWKKLLCRYAMNSEVLAPVWQRVAAAVGATHVAINSPIPLETNSSPDGGPETNQNQENILRRPANLVPIYGDFGPVPIPRTISSPTTTDFERALWVTAKQNGIWQVWAPLYTMFSRGNIREKTRILKLPSVATDFDVPSAAVDLYAGIGYFAFSYKKSGAEHGKGIRRVMCWELNPWSVEGLRRGAEKNGWTCKMIKQNDLYQLGKTGTEARDVVPSAMHNAAKIQEADFWVFQASNEGATSDYASICTGLGLVDKLPIRHVNLGLLPTSKLSWSVAVGMLDEQRGGWIHVHENIGIKDIESRSKEIEEHIARLATHGRDRADKIAVRVEHVEWVKMYAPGVVHCVLDVHVQRAR